MNKPKTKYLVTLFLYYSQTQQIDFWPAMVRILARSAWLVEALGTTLGCIANSSLRKTADRRPGKGQRINATLLFTPFFVLFSFIRKTIISVHCVFDIIFLQPVNMENMFIHTTTTFKNVRQKQSIEWK